MVDISKSKEATLTAEALRKILSYCPITGVFKWKISVSRNKAGDVAGFLDDGYIRIGVSGLRHLAHRLAWLYMLGEWPDGLVDHENRIKSDNRWLNLRLADKFQNSHNRGVSKSSASGSKGVYKCSKGDSWFTSIKVNGKSIYLGTFKVKADAVRAYALAADKYHGEFNGLNKA